MARRDFVVVRETILRDRGLPFGKILTRDYVPGVLATSHARLNYDHDGWNFLMAPRHKLPRHLHAS